RRANPGDSLEYVYDLPPDHYPGTFYYHPHFEGSSSMQTLGGMSGALVVEDPEGSLPPEIEAMREIVMVLQETNIESGTLRNYKAASEIAGSNMPLYGGRGGGGGSSRAESKDEKGETAEEEAGESEVLHFATVNGQYQPIVQAQPGEAFRVRLIHGGNNDHMHVSILPADATATATATQGTGQGARRGDSAAKDHSGRGEASGGCTLLTLARDGVYLRPAPRVQGGGGHVVIAPGSRADLAVLCDEAGVYRLASSKGGNDEEGEEGSIMSYLGQETDVFEGTLAFVDVGGDALDMDLPEESPAAADSDRLLQDLRDIPDDEVSRFLFEFNAADKVSHLGNTYTWYGVNGVQYTNASHVMRRVPLGSVEEWVIVNQRKGRGEGEQGCRPPPLPTPPRPNAKEEPVDAGTGDSRNGDDGVGAVDEGGWGRVPVGCNRGGPGEVTADGHPFHLHVNHFQVVGSSWGDDGPDWSVGDWRDTISIPAPGNVTIRWRADDFTGE
ncbi:unnamed protein product, partial [Ectocarpus sp. 12 AP-2014]